MKSNQQLALAGGCPASFWCFAGAVAAGNVAALGTAWLANRGFRDAHPTTQKTAAKVVGIGTFWLVGGLTWVALARRGA